MASEPYEPWASAMVKQGLTKSGDRPSFRRLAEAAQKVTGTSTPTVQTVINITTEKTGNPSDEIVSALAAALHLPATEVAGWVGRRRELNDPYSPPDGSARLTRKQREAIDHIIRVMIDSEDSHHGAPIGDDQATQFLDTAGEDLRAPSPAGPGGPLRIATPKNL